MGQITLTQVEDELVQAVKARAQATGRSFEDIASEALRQGLLMDRAGLRDAAHRIREMTPKRLKDDSTDVIRRMRDAS
jgi:plasmid stability protein